MIKKEGGDRESEGHTNGAGLNESHNDHSQIKLNSCEKWIYSILINNQWLTFCCSPKSKLMKLHKRIQAEQIQMGDRFNF